MRKFLAHVVPPPLNGPPRSIEQSLLILAISRLNGLVFTESDLQTVENTAYEIKVIPDGSNTYLTIAPISRPIDETECEKQAADFNDKLTQISNKIHSKK